MSSTLRDPSQDYLAALAGCIAAQASTTGATPAWHLLNKLLGSFDALNEDEAIYRLDRFPGNVRLAPLAIALARQATQRFPHSPQAWCLYARALRQEDVGHSEEVSVLERARQLCEAPDAMVLSGLSAAYDRNGQFDKADCTDQELHDALRRSGRVQDALHLAQRRYRPDANTPTWGVNLVHSMWDCGVYDDSIAILEAQHARMPHHAITTMELGSIHLRKGNWASGWANLADGVLAENSTTMDEYGRRWKATLWRGEPLTGKTLFVWAELFSGDSIWLVRYLPAIAARVKALGGNLHFGCDGTLR
ncbi:MAG: hypothetical protein QM803_07645 [Rhodocyclaceae bacterium]